MTHPARLRPFHRPLVVFLGVSLAALIGSCSGGDGGGASESSGGTDPDRSSGGRGDRSAGSGSGGSAGRGSGESNGESAGGSSGQAGQSGSSNGGDSGMATGDSVAKFCNPLFAMDPDGNVLDVDLTLEMKSGSNAYTFTATSGKCSPPDMMACPKVEPGTYTVSLLMDGMAVFEAEATLMQGPRYLFLAGVDAATNDPILNFGELRPEFTCEAVVLEGDLPDGGAGDGGMGGMGGGSGGGPRIPPRFAPATTLFKRPGLGERISTIELKSLQSR